MGKGLSLALFLSVAIVVLCAVQHGCVASKTMQLADEFEKSGRYYEAAQYYVQELEESPDNTDALVALARVAEKGYHQKLALAESDEQNANFGSALLEYREMAEYLTALRRHNVLSFRTVNVQERLSRMSFKGAEQHYEKGETALRASDFETAASEFEEVLKLAPDYGDASMRAAECYLSWGEALAEGRKYREAAEKYLLAETRAPGETGAMARAAEVHYRLGEFFLQKGYCKNAIIELSRAGEIKPAHRDVQNLLRKAEECSVARVTFMSPENVSGRSGVGIDIGDYIFDFVKNEVDARRSEFLRVVDEAALRSRA